jgi:hypothetical protein
MNSSTWKKIAGFTALLVMSTLLMQFVWRVAEKGKDVPVFSPDKVNLALRRTAEVLLRAAGDSISQIPPVEQIKDNVWLLRLVHTLDYDRLPAVLQASFDVHGISCAYDVAVLRCVDGTLQLGYNFIDYSQNKITPCSGRAFPTDCYNLKVTLDLGVPQQKDLPLSWWFFGGGMAIMLFGISRKWHPTPENIQQPIQIKTNWLHFGHSRLDIANQLLVCESTNHHLTYREAKLLHLFAQRPNQVLERSFILDNVWADEGILVGRSVDMFVSRLRKMLRDDPSVLLVAVHGVGYRMEVA